MLIYAAWLPILSDVYDAQLDTNDANDVLIAKTTYTFDDYTAMIGYGELWRHGQPARSRHELWTRA